MTLTPAPFVEAALRRLLIDELAELTEANVRADYPSYPLTGHMPQVTISTVGGGLDRLSVKPNYDIQVFATNRTEARELSWAISDVLLDYPHVVDIDDEIVVIDRVLSARLPMREPWDETDVFRFGATYNLSTRR